MSYYVAVIEHIDLTALFTYRTMSYVAATTLTQKLNLFNLFVFFSIVCVYACNVLCMYAYVVIATIFGE